MTDKTISKILFSAMALFLAACAGTPKAPIEAVNVAHWETKMRLKDLEKNKSHSLSVDVLGERGGAMRMDATAILGYPVASYVMTPEEFRCAVYTSKAFYQGPVTETALRPLLKVPMSPVVLRQVAFDEPLSGWKCTRGADGKVQSCESAVTRVSATWKREGAHRVVSFKGPGFEMEWAFGAPRTDVQLKDSAFVLEAPRGFRVIRL